MRVWSASPRRQEALADSRPLRCGDHGIGSGRPSGGAADVAVVGGVVAGLGRPPDRPVGTALVGGKVAGVVRLGAGGS